MGHVSVATAAVSLPFFTEHLQIGCTFGKIISKVCARCKARVWRFVSGCAASAACVVALKKCGVRISWSLGCEILPLEKIQTSEPKFADVTFPHVKTEFIYGSAWSIRLGGFLGAPIAFWGDFISR